MTVDGPHGKVKLVASSSFKSRLGLCFTIKDGFQRLCIFLLQHVEEVLEYVRYGLWWIALGVASSIGLG